MKNKWEEFYKNKGRYYLKPHPAFQRFLNRVKPFGIKKVVDLGCGSGRHLIPLAEKGYEVTGIDYSPSAAHLAEKWLKTKNLEGKVYVSDIHERLKIFEEAAFDAVIAVKSLQYSTLEQFKDSIKEINRILITGGVLFLVIPSKSTEIKDLQVEQLFFEKEQLRDILDDTFRVLEIQEDSDKNFVVIGQEL